MKTRLLQCLFPLLLLLALTGCREANTFEVALYDDETLSRGDTVYLQGEPVATIEDIYLIGEDQPVAKIRVTDKGHESQFVRGLQRKPGRGEIHLEAPNLAADEDPSPLLTGSRIPLRSVPLPPAFWPPNQNTIIVAGILLVALIVVFFIFRTIIKVALTVVALALAIGGAYLTYPFAVPYAQQAIELTQEQAHAHSPEDPAARAQDQDSIDTALEKVGTFVQREDINPAYLSFGVLAITYFILLSIILGSARKRLGGD